MDGLVFAASNFSMKASMEACDAVVEKGRARETTAEDRLAARARARRVEAMTGVRPSVGVCGTVARARQPQSRAGRHVDLHRLVFYGI